MKKQGFLYGSAVLAVSAVIVKIFGAVFRIPLANMLGGTGMGYFSAAYSVFMPVYAVCAAGLPAAAAKCTADHISVGDREGAQAVKITAMRLFGAVGVCACIVIAAAAVPFCKYSGTGMYALPAMAMIAPSVLAGCLMSVYRGCFEGTRNMYPTAVSQVTEGAAKLVLGLSLCYGCLYAAENYPDAFLKITGCGGKGISAADAALPYGAAAAVLGITLSSYAGLIYLVIRDRREERLPLSPDRERDRRILSELLETALPASLGGLVINLTSLIDLVTVTGALKRSAERYPEAFSALFEGGISRELVPTFIYGSFAGLAVTVFNLVPSITNMFGKSMLPAAAAANASGDRKKLGECACGVITAAAAVSLPAGAGIAFMGGEILRLLFGSRELEISVCEEAMRVLGLAVPFVCMSSAGAAVLQAAGKADIPVKLMAAGAAVKLMGNLILVPVPSLGAAGAAISTLVCYVFIFALTAAALKKYACYDSAAMKGVFAGLTGAALLCGGSAFVMSAALEGRVPEAWGTVISCAAGGCVYLFAAYFSGTADEGMIKGLLGGQQ